MNGKAFRGPNNYWLMAVIALLGVACSQEQNSTGAVAVTHIVHASAPVSAPGLASVPASAPTDFKPAEKPVDEPMRVEELPEDQFSYKHVFIKHFLDGYTVKVQYDMRWSHLPPDASIEQPDGKWVAFSIDDPADRIIRDQPLKDIKIAVPLIERAQEAWHAPDCVKVENEQWCRKIDPPIAEARYPKAGTHVTVAPVFTNISGTAFAGSGTFLGGSGTVTTVAGKCPGLDANGTGSCATSLTGSITSGAVP